MQCLILAGGFATRLWPFTENRAKPLLPLAGKPLLSHTIERLPLEIPIIISTNQAYASDFRKWADSYPDRNIEIFIEDAEAEDFKPGALAGTALAIEKLQIDSNLLLIAGDNYFGFDISNFIAAYKGRPLLAAYDIKEKSLARKFGVVVEKWGKLVEFQEKPAEPKSTLVSTGCYVIPRHLLHDLILYSREYADNLGGLFEYFLRQRKEVSVWGFDEPWFDIGSFKDYMAAHKFLMKEERKLMGQARLIDSKTRGSVILGNNVTLEDSVVVDSIILDNAKVVNCVVKNSIIDENANISGLDLDHKIIRKNTKIEIPSIDAPKKWYQRFLTWAQN